MAAPSSPHCGNGHRNGAKPCSRQRRGDEHKAQHLEGGPHERCDDQPNHHGYPDEKVARANEQNDADNDDQAVDKG